MICWKCSKEISEDSKFCRYCGASSNACQKCGKDLDANSKFCKYCGASRNFASDTYTPTVDQATVEIETPKAATSNSASSTIKFVLIIMVGVILALTSNWDWVEENLPSIGLNNKDEYITLAEYNSIETGMSYLRVRSIVGSPGEELVQSDVAGYKSLAVSWKGVGSMGANAQIMFVNDAVISKAQVGLK